MHVIHCDFFPYMGLLCSLLIGPKDNQRQNALSCYPKMYERMVKYMLHFLDAEIQITYTYGQNNHSLTHIIYLKIKKYVKNVVYEEIIRDGTLQ